MKQVRRSVKQILFSLTLVMVFFINIHPVMAQEISNESKNAIWNEFEEKRENGLEVYELLDDNGNFMGYYEPYSETNPEPVKTARYTANINWEIPAGKYSYGENQYTLSSGSKIQVSISQSQTGTSYLTFQNRTSNSSLRFTNTKVTNGWKGTVVLGNISSAVYSFGIENASSVQLHILVHTVYRGKSDEEKISGSYLYRYDTYLWFCFCNHSCGK